MELFVLLWIVCGIAAAFIASNRGANGCLWFGLGVLLGPIGLAISFGAGDGLRCTACRKYVRADATKCPSCQTDLRSREARDVVSHGIVLKEGFQEEATKRCPFCAEKILAAAVKCRYCGEKLP